MWIFNVPLSLNALLHIWHLYGFSPLWILQHTTRLCGCVNLLLQTVHSNGFFAEWLFLCLARSFLHLQHSSHILCTCIYLHEFSYGCTNCSELKNISHTEGRCTGFLGSVTYCDHCYQLQSLLEMNFHLYNVQHNTVLVNNTFRHDFMIERHVWDVSYKTVTWQTCNTGAAI